MQIHTVFGEIEEIMNIELSELSDSSYKATAMLYGVQVRHGYPRAFVVENKIFLNKDAFFLLGNFSKLQLIAHEIGHVLGLNHSWKNPIMWAVGILRP